MTSCQTAVEWGLSNRHIHFTQLHCVVLRRGVFSLAGFFFSLFFLGGGGGGGKVKDTGFHFTLEPMWSESKADFISNNCVVWLWDKKH